MRDASVRLQRVVRSLLDYVSQTAREHPTAPALLFKGATITYQQLERLSDACAAALAAHDWILSIDAD